MPTIWRVQKKYQEKKVWGKDGGGRGGGAGEVWKVSTEDLKIFFQAKLVKKIDSSCGVNMSRRNILTQAQKERPR